MNTEKVFTAFFVSSILKGRTLKTKHLLLEKWRGIANDNKRADVNEDKSCFD